MENFDIHIIGVGGQGIGLLSEILLRAADDAGFTVKAVDTHGLAQRGGIVISRLRLGERAHSPLIARNRADLAIALERHEALRAINTALRDGGTLVYYDAVWQPLPVRLKEGREVSEKTIEKASEQRGIALQRIFRPNLADSRMQNIVLLAHVCKHALIPGMEKGNYRRAMEDLMTGPMLEENVSLFEAELTP